MLPTAETDGSIAQCMWAFSTLTLRYFLYRASRSGEIVNGAG